jgi:hypothetical protein
VVRLWYRHVNQAERWESVEMTARGGIWRSAIPGPYTDAPYPLQYYFAVTGTGGEAWLCPGFEPDLANRPYFLLRRT